MHENSEIWGRHEVDKTVKERLERVRHLLQEKRVVLAYSWSYGVAPSDADGQSDFHAPFQDRGSSFPHFS